VARRVVPRGGTPSGPDPKRASYGSFFGFADPDGNAWLVQEVTHAPSRPLIRHLERRREKFV